MPRITLLHKVAAFTGALRLSNSNRRFAVAASCLADSRVGSAPFPLFLPVILAPVFGRPYSSPTTFLFRSHKIKVTDRAAQTDDNGCSERL